MDSITGSDIIIAYALECHYWHAVQCQCQSTGIKVWLVLSPQNRVTASSSNLPPGTTHMPNLFPKFFPKSFTLKTFEENINIIWIELILFWGKKHSTYTYFIAFVSSLLKFHSKLFAKSQQDHFAMHTKDINSYQISLKTRKTLNDDINWERAMSKGKRKNRQKQWVLTFFDGLRTGQ